MRLPSRHTLAPIGILLVAIGLADRLAFLSFTGAVFLVSGFGLLGLAITRPDGRGPNRDLVYPALFVVLAVVAAVSPFDPGPKDPASFALTVASPVAFYLAGAVARLRRFRLYLAGGFLIAAHAAFIVHVPHPQHQDVYKFLNLGVDALLRGHDPYGPIAVADGGPFNFTYPPAVLLLLAPFRVLFHDIRWAYILSEAITVVVVKAVIVRRLDGRRALGRWQEALVLAPLALPRTSQAFYVYSNHEWLLLALAAGALYLALRRHWAWCGLVLALGIASKQYFLVFPVLFLLPVINRRALALGGGGAVAITLPFVIWDWHRFFEMVLGTLGLAPDPGRLTLWAVVNALGAAPGRAGALALTAVGILSTLVLLARSRANLADSLMNCGLALAVFSLCSPFAAYNYYVYGLVFLTWGLALSTGPGISRPSRT